MKIKIKELIEVYQKLLPIYKNNQEFRVNGLCCNAHIIFDISTLYHLFSEKGYYKNYIKLNGYLEGPNPWLKEGNLFRIEFMKKEIIELKKLLKEGYTDI